jgi:hypothetical protein
MPMGKQWLQKANGEAVRLAWVMDSFVVLRQLRFLFFWLFFIYRAFVHDVDGCPELRRGRGSGEVLSA